MAAPYVQVRTRRRLRRPDQPDPRPDPNPNPNPKPNPTRWGARGLLSSSAGAVLRLRANLQTLHVRAIKRLMQMGQNKDFKLLATLPRMYMAPYMSCVS